MPTILKNICFYLFDTILSLIIWGGVLVVKPMMTEKGPCEKRGKKIREKGGQGKRRIKKNELVKRELVMMNMMGVLVGYKRKTVLYQKMRTGMFYRKNILVNLIRLKI